MTWEAIATARTHLVGAAFEGSVDIVGDVHGEIAALEALLAVLGYDRRGRHREGRRLIFIGDLCDRGPDSPAVIGIVNEMARDGVAQCLLGNHELNVLRGAHREANGWFFEADHDRAQGRFLESRPAADAAARGAIRAFFASLPLALERSDLRLVHACWNDDLLDELRIEPVEANPVDLYRRYASRSDEHAHVSGRAAEVTSLLERYGGDLRNPHAQVPMLEALATHDIDYQMSNPLRVLTSGTELRAEQPYFMAGKWRMVRRGAWWQQYRSAKPVFFGHYWRWATPDAGERFGRHAINPFPDRAFDEWLGAADSAFCIDYCIGARFAERRQWPGEQFRSRLGAVRWPERELIFEDGTGAELVAPRLRDPVALRSAG